MDKRFISRFFARAHDRSWLAVLGGLVVFGLLSMLTADPACALIGSSETFDYIDGDGYQPADSNPFDDPPTGTSPAFWTGNGEYRSSATYGLIEEAPSGTNGITSANGSIGHAEFYPQYAPSSFDTFHRNGGGSNGVPFTAPYSFKMDIYLDPSWTYRCPAGGCLAEDDFWINQGVNDNLPGPPNGNYLSEGSLRFNVTDIAPTDGTVEYSFHTGPGGPIGSLFQTTTPGWYTLEQIVNVGPDGGDPGTDPDILFTHRIWNVQRTQILSNPNTFPSFNNANGALLGGDRYSSFFFVHSNITPRVAIDNVSVGAPLVNTLVVDDDGMASLTDCNDATPCFSTISAAITAANPGDIVSVCPGTYAGNLVLAKAITLSGAQFGVDACGRVAASESIITGAGGLLTLTTGSAGAIIDGFTFSGGTRSIESASGPLNNVQIRNNRCIGFTNAAIFLNDSGTDMTLHQNSVDGASKVGGGGLVHLDTDPFLGFHFTDNCIVNGPTATGFFVDGVRNVRPSGARAPLFSGNLISGCVTGANLGSRGFSGGTISNNTVSSSGFDGLQGGIQETAITGNLFQSNGRWGLALTSFGNTADSLRGGRNCLITLNTFADNDSAGLFYSATQFPGYVATNVANNNNIAGNGIGGPGFGFIYRGSETVDLKCNWWGDIGGPDHPSNPNPPADGLFAANPVFVPWLNGAAPGGLCNQYGTSNSVAANTTGLCISPSTPCVTVPVDFSRTDVTEARAASVTFQLSANLELCGTPGASIAQGSWLGAWTNKTFLVVSNGGGSYTVDQAILGETPTACGVTTGGTLFTVMIKKTLAAGDGSGTITVTDVDIRDCDNPAGVLPGVPGAPTSITIDSTAPPAAAALTAVQDKTSNGTDGLTFIDVTVPAVGAGDSVRVRRKGFGNYPEYDDAPGAGSVPAIPATEAAAIAAGWTVAFTTPPGGGVTVSHQPPTRDFWYFVAFVKDPCGNVSSATSITSGNLNYHLGDVTPTGTPGDNDVDGLDISRLGSAYGFTLGPADPNGDIDVGPTTNFSTNGRPTTDNLIGYEDLLMFAINFGTVSFNEPLAGVVDTPGGRPELELATESTADGILVRVLLRDNPGTVKGIHALVDYDHSGLTLVTVEEGALFGAQGGRPTFFRHLDEGAAGIHAALLGAGLGIHGSGEIARLRFRGRGAVELVHSDLRDLENRFLGDPPATAAVEDEIPAATPVPGHLELFAAQPNPFNPSTMLRFTLVAADQVNLRIYDVNGRLVRTLVDGVLAPGQHSAFWDGRSSQGAGAGSGVYVVRLTVGGRELTQKIQLLK